MPTAYALARRWYAWRRPARRTVQVAVWCGGRLLLVSHSYKEGDTLPGGGVRHNEMPVRAAVRELHEEAGITVAADALACIGEKSFDGRYGVRTTSLYEVSLATAPQLRVNGWETTGARWAEPKEIRQRARTELFAAYFERRLGAPPAAA